MLQVSTGFKTAILGPTAFDELFNGGTIRVYSGEQPVSADAPASGTWLGDVTRDGQPWAAGVNGLRFYRQGPFVVAAPGAPWLLGVASAGTAAWWRLVPDAADAGPASLNVPRIDGAVGTVIGSAEMILHDVALQSGTVVLIGSFFYSIPPLNP